MAAVQMGVIELLTGSEGKHAARGKALASMVMGEAVLVDATESTDTRFDFNVKKAAAETYVLGIVLDETVLAGEAVDFVVRGEIEGFIDLTPNTFLSVVDGVLDDTAPVAGAPLQFYVVSPTRVFKLY